MRYGLNTSNLFSAVNSDLSVTVLVEHLNILSVTGMSFCHIVIFETQQMWVRVRQKDYVVSRQVVLQNRCDRSRQLCSVMAFGNFQMVSSEFSFVFCFCDLLDLKNWKRKTCKPSCQRSLCQNKNKLKYLYPREQRL